MEKPFMIEYRSVEYIGGKVSRRGKWFRYDSYKTLQGLIDAYDHVRKQNVVIYIKGKNGKMIESRHKYRVKHITQ